MSTMQPTRLMTRSRRSRVCSSDQTRIAEPTQPSTSSHGVPMGATLALRRRPVRGSDRPSRLVPDDLEPDDRGDDAHEQGDLDDGEALPAGRHGPRHRERRPETRPHGIRRPDGDGAHGPREADHAERAGDDEDDGRDRTREASRRSERRGPDRLEDGADEQDDPRHQATTLSPATQATRTTSSAARPAPSRSSRRATASRTVPTAPMPTHTAYAVPAGRAVIAHARPTMLSTSETAKTAVGRGRRKPSDAASAVAQTASSAPDRTSTSQCTAIPIWPSCRRAGTAPSSASTARALTSQPTRCTRARPGRNGVSGARPGVLSSAGALLRTEDRHEP